MLPEFFPIVRSFGSFRGFKVPGEAVVKGIISMKKVSFELGV